MKTIIDMVKCSLRENCLEDSIIGVLKIYELRSKIIDKVLRKEPVPRKLINTFAASYKVFSRVFFSKKTIECIFKKCKKYIPKNLKSIDRMINKIRKLKIALEKQKKTPLIKNYKIMINLLEAITIDFSIKFQKKFLASTYN